MAIRNGFIINSKIVLGHLQKKSPVIHGTYILRIRFELKRSRSLSKKEKEIKTIPEKKCVMTFHIAAKVANYFEYQSVV
ncbi:MAG: hypothetical protein RLZZ241_197 [Bacteroidota bacterium]|jgi:hypothetical protein